MASIISAGTTSGTSLNLSGDTSGVLQLATNGSTTAVTINASQNVGIGTASPSCRLDLNRGSAGLLANFTDGVNTNFQIGTTSLLATIGPSAGSTAMAFKTGDTERMRIDSSGNVGIGTSSPATKLDVRGNALFGANGRILLTESSGDAIIGGAAGTNFTDMYVNGALNTRFNLSGSLVLKGGATGATGTGITFPATQSASSDANTLDDYEEGTWTPQAGSDAGAFTATYTGQAGRYVKIGNRVWATFDFILASRTLTGSVAVIYGLPFSVASNGDLSGSFGSVALSQNTGVNFNYLGLYAQNASSFIYVTYTTTATNNISIAPNTFFGSVTRVSGGVMYNTTS